MRRISLVLMCLVVLSAPALPDAMDDARSLMAQGRFNEAYVLLRGYVDAHPEDAEALVALAQTEFDGAKSQEYYRRALRADPQGASAAVALMGIAQFYFAGGFYANAHRMAQRVLDEFPSSPQAPWARLLIGRALLASGQPREAAAGLRPLLDASDQDLRVAAAIVWAQASLDAGDVREVIRVLSDRRWRPFPYVLGLLAEAYERMGATRDVRNTRWRAVLARRTWKGESLTASEAAPARPPEAPVRTPSQAEVGAPSVEAVETYSLQVGAFRNRENAQRLQQLLRGEGFEVTIRRTGSLHRVLVGNYATTEQARAARPEVFRAVQKYGITAQPVIVKNR